jgi:hypothetical protein
MTLSRGRKPHKGKVPRFGKTLAIEWPDATKTTESFTEH